MKHFRSYFSILFLLLCFNFLSSSTVNAQVIDFESIHLELDVTDSTIIIPRNTSAGDPIWEEAGIADVSSEKKHLSQMGGLAVIYDPSTKTLVRLLCKTSKQSNQIFNLNLISDAERTEFYDSLAVSDENIVTTVTTDESLQSEVPFFRMQIDVTDGALKEQELVYGTIVNGSMIYFDLYCDTSSNVNEDFLKSLVASSHFTKQYTKQEYREMSKRFLIRMIVILVVLVLIVIGFMMRSKKRNKQRLEESKRKSDALNNYYSKKKEDLASGKKESPRYENHTTYSQELIHQFCNYTFYGKRMPYWISIGVLYFILLVLIVLRYGIGFPFLLAVFAAFVILYFQHYRIEKVSTQLWKQYEASPSKLAHLRFYDDHFTLSEIQHLADYPYLQIASVCESNDYIYLYFTSDRGLFLAKDGFLTTTDTKEFLAFLRECMKGDVGNE